MSGFLAFTIIIVSIFVIIVLICLLVDYAEYHDSTEGKPTIKFSTFRKFYDINPSRWILNDSRVICKVPRKDIERTVLYSSFFDREEIFVFNYRDTWRYRRWHEELQNQCTEQNNDKATLRMLEAVKLDIAALEDQSKHEINEAKSILKGIYDVKS